MVKTDGKLALFNTLDEIIGNGGASLFVIFVSFTMACEICLRKLFNTSLYGLEELIALSMIGITFLPLSVIQKVDGHVRMDLFTVRLKPKTGRRLEAVVAMLMFLTGVAISYAGCVHVVRLYSSNAVTVVRGIHLWPFYILFPLGGMLFSLRMVLFLVRRVKQTITSAE